MRSNRIIVADLVERHCPGYAASPRVAPARHVLPETANLFGALTKGPVSSVWRSPQATRLGEARRGVDPGTDRRTAERKPVDARQTPARPDPGRPSALRHNLTIPGQRRERRRIPACCVAGRSSQMSSHSTALAAIALRSAATAGIKRSLTLTAAAMWHRRWKGVVRRLRHVDVVVGMNRMLAAERCAGKLASSGSK